MRNNDIKKSRARYELEEMRAILDRIEMRIDEDDTCWAILGVNTLKQETEKFMGALMDWHKAEVEES